jgi:hypothetical protein
MASESKTAKTSMSPKDTLLYVGKSLYSNQVLLENEGPFWVAVLILLIAIVGTVSGTLYSGYTSSAAGIASTSTETAIDVGFSNFAYSITGEKQVYIENNLLNVDGTNYSFKFLDANNASTTIIDPSKTIQHKNGDTDIDVLNVYFLDDGTENGIDPIHSSADSTVISNFISTSVLKYDSTKAANTWTPCSYMIVTKAYIRVATYKVVGAKVSDSAVTTIYGDLTQVANFDFYTLGHADGKEVEDTVTVTNTVNLLNQAYRPVLIAYTWQQVGINAGMSLGVVVIGSLIFWLISRSKNSIIHFNFMQAFKILSFMSLSPALITFVASFWFASYSSFIFLMIIALRIMSAVQRLSANSTTPDDKPVYKARS